MCISFPIVLFEDAKRIYFINMLIYKYIVNQ